MLSGNCFAPSIIAAYEKRSCSGVCIRPIRDRLISINMSRTLTEFNPFSSICNQSDRLTIILSVLLVFLSIPEKIYIPILGMYQPGKMFPIFQCPRNNGRRVDRHLDLMLQIAWRLPRNVKRPLDIVVLQSLAKLYNENVRFPYYRYFPSPLYCR